MFRVAPKKDEQKSTPKVEMEVNVDGEAEEDEEEEKSIPPAEPSLDGYPAHKVSPVMVLYMGPEMGPFECQNCVNWLGDGECAIVSGEIDPGGKCNLFESPGPEEGPIDLEEQTSPTVGEEEEEE